MAGPDISGPDDTGYDAAARERLVPEPAKASGPSGRSPFERDRARVLHSAALRRLAGKTQVVVVGEDDFPRTRLTHTLECAQIGREMAAALGADPDVVDAACLAHDLGHPPFGHNGETALHAAAEPCGGFEGNAQSFRLLTRLEVKVPDAGLNLTRAVLDAACKYPWSRRAGTAKFGVYADDLATFGWVRAGVAGDRRSLEAQVMDWADDVAYSVHDFEDGVHSGVIDPTALDPDLVVATTREVYLPDADADLLRADWQALTRAPWWPGAFDGGPAAVARLKRLTSELIGRFCGAAVGATRHAHPVGPLSRYAADLVVPPDVARESALLKAAAVAYVMRGPGRSEQQHEERAVVADLVRLLVARGAPALQPLLRPAYETATDDAGRLRAVVDQVASLSDAGARAWHRSLTTGRAPVDAG